MDHYEQALAIAIEIADRERMKRADIVALLRDRLRRFSDDDDGGSGRPHRRVSDDGAVCVIPALWLVTLDALFGTRFEPTEASERTPPAAGAAAAAAAAAVAAPPPTPTIDAPELPERRMTTREAAAAEAEAATSTALSQTVKSVTSLVDRIAPVEEARSESISMTWYIRKRLVVIH